LRRNNEMSTLIAYAGRNGTSRQIAEGIASRFNTNVEIVDLQKQPHPDIGNYKNIILGGSVMAGSVPKALQNLIKNNTETLLQKNIGLFLSCLIEKDVDSYFKSNFPGHLYSHARKKSWMGGELIMKDHNFIVRKMLKKIIGSDEDIHNLRWEEADSLAAAFDN